MGTWWVRHYGLYYFGFSRMVTKEVEDFKLGLVYPLLKKEKELRIPLLTTAPGGPPFSTSSVCCQMSWNLSFPSTHSWFNPLQTDCYLYTPDCSLEIISHLSVMYRHLFFLPYLCKRSLLADAPSLLSSGVCGTVSTLLLCLFAFKVDMFSSSDCFSSRLMCFVNCVNVPFC